MQQRNGSVTSARSTAQECKHWRWGAYRHGCGLNSEVVHDGCELVQDADMVSEVCGQHQLDDQVPEVLELQLVLLFQKVVLLPPQDPEGQRHVEVLQDGTVA
jgi:hypothetical protein